MNGVPVHILLVEDNVAEARLLQKMLTEPGGEFEVTHVETLTEALEQLQHRVFEAALVDLSLPDSRGLGTVEHLVAAASQLPIVVLTGLDDEALATEAIRKGAQDYLVKGEGANSLFIRAIRYARERKQAEEALKEADRRKDEFLAMLAHELRNPLAPISNALGLLRQTEDDVATFRHVRTMMERQLKHLVRLVDDLLDVSRITRGKIELRRECLDLAAVVHSCAGDQPPSHRGGAA